ncbi:hypothetical protein HLB44_11750 [Aquincola sp. S2]|uniref:PEP-CTERM sorting domain-containing protein n=1 Tax=Pseudaquabacterium terrae TaxID=2732868 RepID=A0ABX2EGC9_9BURK|nr:cohesin domain-containing protein [Aquabacterium terrae]NRF67659.1 hypothetical protein [Aquabacterium terrae]
MKKLIASCGFVLGTLLSAAPAGAVPVLSFTPSSTHINVGDSVTIDATVSGLGAEILSAYDLNFTYDPALLNWQVITQFISPFNVNFSAISGFDNVVQGDLGFFLNSLDTDADLAANQPDSFLLFRFTLQGMTDGVTTFTLGPDLDFDRNFVGLDAQTLDLLIGTACVAVGTGQCRIVLPEPPVYALLGLALAAAALTRTRRRSASTA